MVHLSGMRLLLSGISMCELASQALAQIDPLTGIDMARIGAVGTWGTTARTPPDG
mgnify:CR=1 FL=1